MFVAALFQLQVSISFTVAFSSIYLFVTSPTVYDDHERCCDHLNNSTSDIQVGDEISISILIVALSLLSSNTEIVYNRQTST